MKATLRIVRARLHTGLAAQFIAACVLLPLGVPMLWIPTSWPLTVLVPLLPGLLFTEAYLIGAFLRGPETEDLTEDDEVDLPYGGSAPR